jgi:hypothetical protein
VGFSLALAVPVLVIFAIHFGWFKRKEKENDTRFVGIQMDIAILIIGIVLLLALIGWVKTLFG